MLGPPAADEWFDLRSVIARFHRLGTEEVIGALGASQGLWLALSALLGQEDEVLIEQPTYEPMVNAAASTAAAVRRFDRGAIPAAASAPTGTRVVAVTNLHNPSGVRATDEALRAIAGRMAAQGGFLFVD